MDNSNVKGKVIMLKIKPNIIPVTAIQRLELFPSISSGWFIDIWKYRMSTQSKTHPVAVKAMIRRKAYVWIQLSHDNILPLEGVTEGFGPLPALVTPWMENGSLNTI
ncbi:hypothetical protein F4604DRAFT_352390 [Suillus subluteus]|nr:hypothetical protein F4604DRAFT_352390 [Suillus subluteus]